MRDAEFADLHRVLTEARALTDLAEAHGTLSGAMCAASTYSFDDWLGEVFAEGRATTAASEPMRALYDFTRSALASDQMVFSPLLPDDEVALEARTTALGQWCQGFLYGLGTNTIRDAADLPDDVAEIVRDIGAITQVGVDQGETEEANEGAYAELVEFVRVAVQLLFDELATYRAPLPTTASESLH